MDYIELFCCDLYTECPVYKAKVMNMELEEKDKAKLKNGGVTGGDAVPGKEG